MKRKPYQDYPLIYILEDAFTNAECQSFINLSEQYNYEEATITLANHQSIMRKDIRNNERLIYDDTELSSHLYEKFKHWLPQSIADWDIQGLNERFRFYRYQQGQTFKPHFDAPYERSESECSLLTFLIYLNDDFEGGETIFYRYYGAMNDIEENYRIKPKMGHVLIFEHKQLHEGAPIVQGCKYVLRTDVMYKYKFSR